MNKKVLLSVGNLIELKGHVDLINAVKLICSKRSDVILIIVGAGCMKEKLKQQITDLRLNDKIFLVGGRKNDEICLWMNAADILILPSLHMKGFL